VGASTDASELIVLSTGINEETSEFDRREAGNGGAFTPGEAADRAAGSY
jgi:hypothetical protein